MGYSDFVWFLLAEEDKEAPSACSFWFRVLDMDGDGQVSLTLTLTLTLTLALTLTASRILARSPWTRWRTSTPSNRRG